MAIFDTFLKWGENRHNILLLGCMGGQRGAAAGFCCGFVVVVCCCQAGVAVVGDGGR